MGPYVGTETPAQMPSQDVNPGRECRSPNACSCVNCPYIQSWVSPNSGYRIWHNIMKDLTSGTTWSFDWGEQTLVCQTHLQSISDFFLDFGYFILIIMKNLSFWLVLKKNIFKQSWFLGGHPPFTFWLGDASPIIGPMNLTNEMPDSCDIPSYLTSHRSYFSGYYIIA